MNIEKKMEIVRTLVNDKKVKLILFVVDGLGGINREGKTELEVASKPKMDELAEVSSLGMIVPIFHGITPGSGPAHLALFGYDPLEWDIGRGVLSALGSDVDMRKGDVSARGNFATVDERGVVIDRRAGRISDEECKRLCDKLNARFKQIEKVEVKFYPEKEHRFVLHIRGKDISPHISDTDPQRTGVRALQPRALSQEADATVEIVESVLKQVKGILADEVRANFILLRGFSSIPEIPSFDKRFGLNACAIAEYPMYRGLAKLVGMTVLDKPSSPEEVSQILKENYDKYDFFYIHFKKTDSMGEDGNFDGKVKAIERADKIVGEMLSLSPDVMVITGDHSTPSYMKSHSWHPVPLLLYSETARRDGFKRFDEMTCRKGSLGIFESSYLIPLMLAHAGKLNKFGA